jgi:hypothetical protein
MHESCIRTDELQPFSGYMETGYLERNDDNYSGAVELGFAINFGGETYTQTFVSNNGYVTFGEGSGQYSPDPFDASYGGLPIIAAFFSDVDTRDLESGLVSWGRGMVDGLKAFVANWPAVGEYGQDEENFSANTFSMVIVSRADLAPGSFDVHFNYGSITWDHGAAVAGFHNGNSETPQFYQLPGSFETGAFVDGGTNPLAEFTNAGVAGGYLLQARDGEFLVPGDRGARALDLCAAGAGLGGGDCQLPPSPEGLRQPAVEGAGPTGGLNKPATKPAEQGKSREGNLVIA